MYHFWVLKTSFLESTEWLLLQIKTYNCVRLTPRQCTQVCATIKTNFLKPENGLLKYGNNHYFRGVRKKKIVAKSSNLLLGKKKRMKTNLHRGIPNIFNESTLGEMLSGQVLKIVAKGHYKRWSEIVDNPLNINSDIKLWSLVVKMACCWFLCLRFFICDTMSANHIGMQIKMWVQSYCQQGQIWM